MTKNMVWQVSGILYLHQACCCGSRLCINEIAQHSEWIVAVLHLQLVYDRPVVNQSKDFHVLLFMEIQCHENMNYTKRMVKILHTNSYEPSCFQECGKPDR